MDPSRVPNEQGLPWFKPVILICIGMVLGIIVLGLGISSLWHVRVRDGGVGLQSKNRLAQIGKALHNFDSSYFALPPAIGGTPTAGAGTTVDHPKGKSEAYSKRFPYAYVNTLGLILPYMEQEPLFNSMKVDHFAEDGIKQTFYDPTSSAMGGPSAPYVIRVKDYCSPADPSLDNCVAQKLVITKPNIKHWTNANPLSPPSGVTSYAANFKVFGELNQSESAIKSFDRGLTIANIPDGASTVILMAEKYGVCTAAAPIPGAPTNQGIPVVPTGSGGSLWAEPNLNENSPFFAYPQGGNNTYAAGVGLKFQVQPNPFNQKCNPFRASTPHKGGILVLMGDGHVRSVSPSVSDTTWYQAVTPDDGQQLGSDW